MKKILVFGKGYIGSYLTTVLGATPAEGRLGVSESEIRRHKPDVVINAAGVTGHPNVDACEADAALTMTVNTSEAIRLGTICGLLGVHLIHLGSGCIFYGHSVHPAGWSESDFALPQSTYSVSKWAADLALRQMPGVAILRLRMPISYAPHPRNLITKLVSYAKSGKVIDVQNSITVREDLPGIVQAVIERRATGIFHCTRPDPVSHREILAAYSRVVEPLEPTWIPDYNLWPLGLVERPRSSVILQTERLKEIGVTLPPLGPELDDLMQSYKERL